MFAPIAASLLLAAATQPASEQPTDTVVLGVQMPAVEGHERMAASMQAHAETAGVTLDIQFYDPAAFDISALGPRSRALIENTEADDVLWLIQQPPPMRLYLYEGDTEAVWSREVEGDGLDAMATEVVSNVSVTIGLALQVGEVRDMQPVDPEELEPEPPPEPEPAPEPQPEPEPQTEPEPEPQPEPPAWPSRHTAPVWVRASYVGNTFSSGMPWQNGIGLRLTWKPLPRLAVWARYTYVATQAIELGGIMLDLRRHPITAGAGARLPLTPRLDLGAGAAVTLDPVTRVLGSGTPPSVQSSGNGLRLHSSALAYASVGVHVVPRVRLALDLAFDVLLTRADVVVQTGSATARHEPNPARLSIAAGVEVGLGGREKK